MDSGVDSKVDSKILIFHRFFNVFEPRKAAGTAPAQRRQIPARRAGPPRGGFRGPFFHLKNPIAKRY